MKKLLTIALFSSLLAISSQAASIVAAAGVYNGFSLPDGSELSAGNQVRVGSFTGFASDSAIQNAVNSGNFAALANGFAQFGTAHIGDSFGGISGYFKSDVLSGNSDTLGLANAQVYLWVFKTSNNLDPNVSFSNVTAMGIYYLDKSTPGVGDAWFFRSQGATPNSTTVDISDLTNGTNALVSGAHVVTGSFPGSNSVGVPGAKNFNLASVQVPEPSSAVLLLSGLAAFAGYRRKRA